MVRFAAITVVLTFAACPSRSPDSPTDTAPEVVSTPEPEPELADPELALELAPELPEPEPPPEPFPGRSEVSVGELLAALTEQVDAIAASPAVRSDYEQLLIGWQLTDDPELYLDYVRIKLAFEATRAGGLWGVTWQITNELPQSDLVWAQWQQIELADDAGELPEVTAIAECDELSALFAFVVQRIGLSKRSEVGLFWPTGNHTVAVWTLDRKSEHATRLIVPTSQIYLDSEQSLGTGEFNPWNQKHIYDYRRKDAALDLELPASLARGFVRAVQDHGGRSQAELQDMRNQRERRQGELR